MRGAASQCCITRLVDGAGHSLPLAQLQGVLWRIQAELGDVPMAQRIYLANALLTVAVNQLLLARGALA